MKKGNYKRLISAFGNEKQIWYYVDEDNVYLSNGFFILRTRYQAVYDYITQEVFKRKKKPEMKWEDKVFTLFSVPISMHIVENPKPIELKDGRICFDFQFKDENIDGFSRINIKFMPNSDCTYFVQNGRNKAVYGCIGNITNPEAELYIMPVYVAKGEE